MNQTLNTLNELWIEAGEKVENYNDKINQMLKNENFSAQTLRDLTAKRDNAQARCDALRNQVVEVQATQVAHLRSSGQLPLGNGENQTDHSFISDFKALMRGDSKITNLVTSSKDESGEAAGLTIPQDLRTSINVLKRQYDVMEQYVNVENVTTASGSRVYEKWTNITPLTKLDSEDETIGANDDPNLKLVKYQIGRYGGITTATNSLLKDSAENIMSWLTGWIAKKVVVSRNKEIISLMQAAPKKPALSTFDDIITMINTAVDPAIKATSILITNTSGLNQLTLVKDALGNYLLQPDPVQPDRYLIKGKRVVEISDHWLPSGGETSSPLYPLYYGDFKQAMTLFDRENMSLLPTNIGAGAFETDTTKIRVIDRFDVQLTDTEAFVAGSFTAISDQKGNINTAATPTTTNHKEK
ncbi:phage major capsid protein [Lactococcus lactis]|uniref:phage major capsid protein n=1 Tax=Lactococcus lactis TaxID=1358 RepID=UPI001BA50597|nr:phage major capsid protein [Lactococcus lactis]MBR8679532.1 phage major capsid protein [Lactococcus lactis subsp. lactis]MBR8681892.1 phage major capsid protein [Lactococcus lactis subsp. lactis]MBR8687016.1 phage major capsid protein [Lactococcus lactis subsp. lactis]